MFALSGFSSEQRPGQKSAPPVVYSGPQAKRALPLPPGTLAGEKFDFLRGRSEDSDRSSGCFAEESVFYFIRRAVVFQQFFAFAFFSIKINNW